MNGNWLPQAQLTASGRPVLQHGEIERSLQSSVDLEAEENPRLAPLLSGLLALTTHRLIWIDESSSTGYSIILANVIHAYPPKKSIRSMFHSPRIRLQVSVSAEGRIGEKGSRSEMITIVMRGKNDPDAFFSKLWDALRSRPWEVEEKNGEVTNVDCGVTGAGSRDGPSTSVRIAMPVVGVSGILRKEQEIWESTDKSLQDAFQDLNALMSKAKEMVTLAEKMRLKLLSGSSAQANVANDEELGSNQEMQDWLLSVGIASPVTKDSAGALYHQQLSRQLADFVQRPLERSGGMIAVIDIYCLFNRARGTELISPEDLLQACAVWDKLDVPVMLRKFDSGVVVIQNKTHSDEEIFARLKSLALKPNALRTGVSPSDAAIILGIAPALAKEHLLTAESNGLLCRDISPEGFRFFVNLFEEIDPSNIHLLGLRRPPRFVNKCGLPGHNSGGEGPSQLPVGEGPSKTRGRGSSYGRGMRGRRVEGNSEASTRGRGRTPSSEATCSTTTGGAAISVHIVINMDSQASINFDALSVMFNVQP